MALRRYSSAAMELPVPRPGTCLAPEKFPWSHGKGPLTSGGLSVWRSAVIGVLVAPLFDGSDGSVDGVIPRATNLALLGGEVRMDHAHSCLLIPIFIRYSIPRCSTTDSPVYNRLRLLSVI
jgi:hypothetical protein